jgi:sialidase-1
MTLRFFLMLAFAAAVGRGAEPLLTHTDVFRSGAEGYAGYRIPALLVTPDGSLLAVLEGRKENKGDPGNGDIDLVMKRSEDQGATWSKLTVIDDPGETWSASNPSLVTDRTTGRIWLAYNRWKPRRGSEDSRPGTDDAQAWLRWSDDQGKTWSEARDVTKAARDFEAWGSMFFGPGGAIQTRSGRLMLPAAMCPDKCKIVGAAAGWVGSLDLMRPYVVYSDDHGATWRRSELVQALGDESQVVELADGAVMMDTRQGNGERRYVSISRDNGAKWSWPVTGQTVVGVATSIERYTLKAAGGDRNRLLWTGPAGPGRKHLVLRVSYDEGQTWPNEKTLYGGIAAYSELAVLKDGTMGVLWERGVSEVTQFVTFTRVNREFLEPAGTLVPEWK